MLVALPLRTLTTCKMNLHWKPFIARCKYCSVPYTVIGKLETMKKDLHYISQMAGVEFKQGVSKHTSSGGSTAELTRKYFRELDRDVVKQLYQVYQLDFEMFGYSAESFIVD